MAKTKPKVQKKERVISGRITKRSGSNKENLDVIDPKKESKKKTYGPKCIQTCQIPMSSLASFELSPTDFVDLLQVGDGAFANVYRAQMYSRNMLVALKVIDVANAAASNYTREELYFECLIQSQLDHVNISKLLGYFETTTQLVFVLDFYDGGDLYNYIKQNDESKNIIVLPITHERSVRFLRQIALAVEYMHRIVKYIHMDIKPENIQVGRDETVKLADFGCCVPMGEERQIHYEHYGGTISYRPVEMLRKKPFDSTADVWSIGCIAFEMWSVDHSHPFFYGTNSNPIEKDQIFMGLTRMKHLRKKRCYNLKKGYYQMPREVKTFFEKTIGARRMQRFLPSQLLDTPLLIVTD